MKFTKKTTLYKIRCLLTKEKFVVGLYTGQKSIKIWFNNTPWLVREPGEHWMVFHKNSDGKWEVQDMFVRGTHYFRSSKNWEKTTLTKIDLS